MKGTDLRQCGISLAETLVAMAVLSLVAAVMLSGVYAIVKSNEVAREAISAESLARSELEYVQAKGYNAAPWSYTLPGTPPTWDASHTSLPSGYSNYTVTVSAISLGYSPDTIQKVTATVSYGGNQVMNISTYDTQ